MSRKNKLFKIVLSLIIAVLICIAVIPVIFYFKSFGSTQLSSKFDDWVAFSNYWSPFLSLTAAGISALLAYFTYFISKQAFQISSDSYNFTKSAETPRITFEMIHLGLSPYYIIKNAGKVPAVNCFLFIKESNSKNEWDETVNCYTIKPDEIKIISWVPQLSKAVMFYESFSGEKFTTSVENQINNFTAVKKPNHINISSYTDKVNGAVNDEILKHLNGSSESKDDLKMVSELILRKAEDCNDSFKRYLKELDFTEHQKFVECLNEMIVTIQLLDTISKEINTNYIKSKRDYFLKLFWLEIDVRVRIYIKKWHRGIFKDELPSLFREHLLTIHNNLQQFYRDY